jgi:hypothetical protein
MRSTFACVAVLLLGAFLVATCAAEEPTVNANLAAVDALVDGEQVQLFLYPSACKRTVEKSRT